MIDKDLRQLDSERFQNLLDHFLKTARYATIFSGLGDLININLKKDYYVDLELIDKDLFFKVFLNLISHCGLKENDFI